MDNNVNNFAEENKSHVDLKTETKGERIRKEIKDKVIRIISVQIKALKVRAVNLKEEFNYALKEDNYSKLAQKYKKYPVLYFQ